MRSTSLTRVQPWIVAGVVLALYGLWVIVALESGHDARDFTIINRAAVEHCHQSSVIAVDPHYHYPPHTIGYDGAYYYMIALDPVHAPCYLDSPAYRYARILYPITARVLAVGETDWVPDTLILTNLLALAGGTLAIAAWLARKNISPWLALIYGLYPGLFVSLWRDLTEPLSYALVAAAIYLFEFGGQRRVRWSALCFALAILGRETAVIFPVVYALALLIRRDWRSAAELLGISLIPELAYRLFLKIWLGGASEPLPAMPFSGILHYWPWPGAQLDLVLSIIAPALVCALVGLWSLWKRRWSVEVVNLLANVLVLVVLLVPPTWAEYYAAGRATAGVPLAALFCLPILDHVLRKNRSWLWVAGTLWLSPWYFLLPAALLWANPGL